MGEEGKKMKRVMVTFDVDGTLIRSTGDSSNRLHRQAFSHAFFQVFGLKDISIDAIQHHGQTDPLILVNTLVHYGIPFDVGSSKLVFILGKFTCIPHDSYLTPKVASERLPDLKSRMIEYATEHAQNIGEGLEVLPGVSSLLDALSSKGVAIGLVTGNLKEIAWMKMEGLGIHRYFTVPNFGGFGTDHTERVELIKMAATRANELYPEGFDLRVHVGDTPNDILAAENGGALAIGVCTGVFNAEELQRASNGTAVILPDLSDAEAFLKLLGI